MVNKFITRNPENADFNQYWYSAETIEQLVQEIESLGCKRIACLSTPSVFFSMNEDLQSTSCFFDIDEKWAKHPRFVQYDFNRFDALPAELAQSFDLVVIDPPFITKEVWEKYAKSTKFLLAPGGRIILSTIVENESMMSELLQVHPVKFQPSIPHLVYQYNFYCNYETKHLDVQNEAL